MTAYELLVGVEDGLMTLRGPGTDRDIGSLEELALLMAADGAADAEFTVTPGLRTDFAGRRVRAWKLTARELSHAARKGELS